MEIKVPEWILNTKEIHADNCRSVYRDTLDKKLGIPSADVCRQELIQLAKSGAPKPKTKILSWILFSNTNKSYSSYNESFDKLIRKLRPDWFIKSSDVNKQMLIKMAKQGKPRPKRDTKEGRALYRYTSKSSDTYSKSFDKLIRKLRPDWFIKSSDVMRQILIKIAKQGKPRPKANTKEGLALYGYTKKSYSSYNESFDKLIRKLRPDWFIKSSDVNKQMLIKMAKQGKPRPKRDTKEGCALCNYIKKSCGSYSESFDKLIRKLRPDWFEK